MLWLSVPALRVLLGEFFVAYFFLPRERAKLSTEMSVLPS